MMGDATHVLAVIAGAGARRTDLGSHFGDAWIGTFRLNARSGQRDRGQDECGGSEKTSHMKPLHGVGLAFGQAGVG